MVWQSDQSDHSVAEGRTSKIKVNPTCQERSGTAEGDGQEGSGRVQDKSKELIQHAGHAQHRGTLLN